jgi:DNA-binding transcriptional ArsR family regulator
MLRGSIGLTVTAATIAKDLARLGSLLADETRSRILCALMDGRAHTGNELSRHVGVAASTTSEHLSKLLDANFVAVEAQGRHRYWRIADPRVADLLETLGARATRTTDPTAPGDLTYARTCYDHLAGELAVTIYERLIADDHLSLNDEHLDITSTGYDLFTTLGVDTEAIRSAARAKARPCLDWTQRRHHLAGAAGKELLTAFLTNGWIRPGRRPRSVHITETGKTEINSSFGLTNRRLLR